MRPTATRQSALRAPLNTILGTEVNVRLLRILAGSPQPLSGTHLAREADLTPPGVYRALDALRETGLVERLGLGSRGQFRLNAAHPLAGSLRSLFDAEQQRVDELFRGLRDAAERLSPPPRGVWLHGPVARHRDRPGDPLCVAVVADAPDVGTLVDGLREAVAPLEHRYDVTVEVRGLTRADVAALPRAERLELERAETLYGLAPEVYFQRQPRQRPLSKRHANPHAEHDEHLRALGAAIAEKLKTDPSLVDGALRYVRQRRDRASPAEQKELREWETLLRTTSITRLRRFLVDRGARPTRLRQSLPFVNALTKAERDAIVRSAGE